MKIEKVKATMAETKTQIKSLVEPMQLNEKRDEWRKQKAYREQILDPVSTQMVEHKMHLNKTNDQLMDRRRTEKDTLEELQKRKAELQEDLADKLKAGDIDMECHQITVIVQAGKATTALHTPRANQSGRFTNPNYAPGRHY